MINPKLLSKNATSLFINGPVGQLDCLVLTPTTPITGVAIIFHPDPKGGGSNTNKIVQTLAKVLNNKGYICYCPNLRGVGESSGVHDYGIGEVDDAQAIYSYLKQEHPNLELVLAGFSFGTAIASQLATSVSYKKLILIGPAVTRYKVTVTDTSKTIVIHGIYDEVIALNEVLEWCKQFEQPVICYPNTGHFFHGKLLGLQNLLHTFNL